MRNDSWLLGLLALASSYATASPPDFSGINVGELGKVQSETILYRAQAERAKAERDIGAAVTTSSTAVGGLEGLTSQPTPILREPGEPALPVVRTISGSSKKLQATLLFAGGIELDTTAGREIPGGYRVVQVSLDGVTVERKGKRYQLGFSNQAPTGVSAVPTALPGQAIPQWEQRP